MSKASERHELAAQITSVAAERVTWEEAANLTFEEAARAFRQNDDTAARRFRALAQQFDGNRKRASDKQDGLLRQLEALR